MTTRLTAGLPTYLREIFGLGREWELLPRPSITTHAAQPYGLELLERLGHDAPLRSPGLALYQADVVLPVIKGLTAIKAALMSG